MVDDIQIGMMQSTNQTNPTQNQIQRRVPGGMTSLQHDVEKIKSGSNGGSKPLSRKSGRNNKGTSWNNKRELSTKASKKNGSKFDPEDKPFQKKSFQSAENLLNFHYMPLRTHNTSSGRTSSSYHGYRRKRTTTFNKEAFLQANCQFVVNYDVEKYSIHSADPDVLVDWNAIQLVYFPMHEEPSCPICLYPPTAAKMTRCGHVYCWACILHYLSLSEKSWNKCPICHEAVHEKDLKSVVPVVQNKFSRNGTIKMKLMRRPKNSLMTYNMENEESNIEENKFSIWNGEIPSFKLTLATQDMMIDNLLNRERIELLAQLSEAKQEQSGEEAFIEMAISNVETKIQESQLEQSKKVAKIKQIAYNQGASKFGIYEGESNLANLLASQVPNQRKLDAFSDDEHADEKEFVIEKETEIPESLPSPSPVKSEASALEEDSESIDHDERKSRNSASSSTDGSVEGQSDLTTYPKNNDYYYFYQADDGQNIFINSLNARCLIEEYGSLENSPKRIIGQILDFESHTMTRELRKRYRYLSHLPVSCEFVICELMLRPPVLSKQTIHNFMGEFKKRRTARFKKVEEQRKHDMRANAELSREAGFRVYNDYTEDIQIDLSDLTDFPSNLSPDEPLIASASVATSNNNYIEQFPPTNAGMDVDSESASFAQKLRVANLSPPSTTKTCWGTASPSNKVGTGIYTRDLRQMSSTASRNGPSGNDDEDGPNLVAPSLKEMFTAAMVMQSTSVAGTDEKKSSSNKKGKKGKGGGKGTLLFATGAQRKY